MDIMDDEAEESPVAKDAVVVDRICWCGVIGRVWGAATAAVLVGCPMPEDRVDETFMSDILRRQYCAHEQRQ